MLAEAAAAVTDYLQAPSPLADQIGAAAISAWVLQQMKKSDLPWLKRVTEHSTGINRSISLAFAILSTSGISAFWHASGASVAAGGTFTLVLADGWIVALKSSIWKTAQSFIMQQMVYQGLLRHEAGQTAADTVAGAITEHKDELAEAAEAAVKPKRKAKKK